MATKEAYQQKLHAQIKEWDAKFDLLSARAQKLTAEAQIAYQDEVVKLKARRAEANQNFEALAKRGEGAWEEMKDGLETMWRDTSKAMEDAMKRFK
jgi:hypothetical protein